MISVFIPRAGAASVFNIDPGSGIVGTAEADGRVLIDYEGGRFNPGRTWAERCYQAAGRHLQRYPTVARSSVPAEDLVLVGELDLDHGRVSLPGGPQSVAGWVDVSDPAQLKVEEIQHRREHRLSLIAQRHPHRWPEVARTLQMAEAEREAAIDRLLETEGPGGGHSR